MFIYEACMTSLMDFQIISFVVIVINSAFKKKTGKYRLLQMDFNLA